MKYSDPQKALLQNLKARLENEGFRMAFQAPSATFKEITPEEMRRGYKTGDVLRFVDPLIPNIASFDKVTATTRIDYTGNLSFGITFYYFIESSDLDKIRDARKRHDDEWSKVAGYIEDIASQYPHTWDTEYDELIEDTVSWTFSTAEIDKLLSLIIKIRKKLTGKEVLSKDKRS